MTILNPLGIRSLLDSNLTATEPGLTLFLRMKTVEVAAGTPESEFEEFGFHVVQLSALVIDIEVNPPASVQPMSLHNIGLNSEKLFFGAHEFDISHTFVEYMMAILNVNDGYKVWRHDRVIGLVYNNRLFSMESIVPKAVGNEIMRWLIFGNQLEQEVSVRTT